MFGLALKTSDFQFQTYDLANLFNIPIMRASSLPWSVAYLKHKKIKISLYLRITVVVFPQLELW